MALATLDTSGRSSAWSCGGLIPEGREMPGQEWVGGLGSTLIEAGGAGGNKGLVEGKLGKGIAFEM